MAFVWKENLACVATYNLLEGDNFLDQFEDSVIPFTDAADITLGSLRYFPKTTTNAQLIEVLSFEIARKFVTLLNKTYTVKKQHPSDKTAEIISDIAAVFAEPTKTIGNLAELVDATIKFPDEA